MQNRIRAIRKARGWTLTHLAQRLDPAPTPQTLARLETGTRTLSVTWLNRIATALEVDPQDLLTLKDGPASPILASVGTFGLTRFKTPTQIDLSVAAKDPVAIEFETDVGRYHAGDIVVFDRQPGLPHAPVGEGLGESADGSLLFGSIFPDLDGARATIATPPPAASLFEGIALAWHGPAVCLIRRL